MICPECGYDLRGVLATFTAGTITCSECGSSFNRKELNAETARWVFTAGFIWWVLAILPVAIVVAAVFSYAPTVPFGLSPATLGFVVLVGIPFYNFALAMYAMRKNPRLSKRVIDSLWTALAMTGLSWIVMGIVLPAFGSS